MNNDNKLRQKVFSLLNKNTRCGDALYKFLSKGEREIVNAPRTIGFLKYNGAKISTLEVVTHCWHPQFSDEEVYKFLQSPERIITQYL